MRLELLGPRHRAPENKKSFNEFQRGLSCIASSLELDFIGLPAAAIQAQYDSDEPLPNVVQEMVEVGQRFKSKGPDGTIQTIDRTCGVPVPIKSASKNRLVAQGVIVGLLGAVFNEGEGYFEGVALVPVAKKQEALVNVRIAPSGETSFYESDQLPLYSGAQHFVANLYR